jgi:FKBP-type peptidyl-prolyl cis-trans isomerase FkpA
MQSKKARRTSWDSDATKGHRRGMRWRYTQVMIRVVSLMAVLALVGGCGGSNPVEPTPPTAPFTQVDLVDGTGATATAGRTVTVTYALWLYDPNKADGKGAQIPQSSAPFTFVLGSSQVIRGWNQGVAGMKVGGQRRLTIPPDLAYGSSSPGGGIPPDATLVFDIALTAVQ